ncbi:MAG TPA: 3-oxoadipate enol-lactonase [Vicinamibacterales bacterium]
MFITTDDRLQLHVMPGSGAGVPLVLSNSLGTDHALFDAQLPALGSGRPVWRYDTRGHGQSGVPAGESTIERLGRDLLAVIDATGAPAVDLCGVSIGGATALWVATHASDRVRRVVLANTAAKIGDEVLWFERIRTVRAGGMPAIAEATMGRWFTDDFRASHADVVAKFRDTVERTDVGGYTSCCAALRDADLRPVTGRVSCPALVVTGSHDVATPPAAGEWLVAHIAGARLLALDAAHLSNVERAAEFNAGVVEFLAGDDPRDP